MKAGWTSKPIGDVFKVVNGGTPKTGVASNWDGPHAWITPAEMGNLDTPYITESRRTLTDEGLRTGAELVPAGSIILSSRAPIGHLVINEMPMAFNQGCKGLIPSPAIDIKFAYYFLLTNVPLLESLGTGATFKELSGGKLKEVPFQFPELGEQRRIVTLLDEAFADIATAKANAEKNLQNARELFDRALYSIEGKKEQLGEYVTIKTGKLDANAAVLDGKYPFFTCSREIFAIDTFAFDCEAILLAGNNAVGDFNVKHYSGKFNAYQRTYVITIQDEEILRYRYLYFQMLKSLKKFKEQSVGSGTKFLKLGMIKELEITLPPIQEQDRQLKLLSGLLDQVEYLESIYRQKLTALDDLKKSLLHQAFSGQL